jgi:hypothetical protein
VDATRQADYENCLYACRFCNRSRSASPIHGQGGRLLDPATDIWAQHFTVAGDRLLPVPEDPDARYTHSAYELDDPRKMVRRKSRWDLITDRQKLLGQLGEEIAALLRLAEPLRHRDLDRFKPVLQEIQGLRKDRRRALLDLARYAAVPSDAPLECRCEDRQNHSLPHELDRQTFEIPDSDFRGPIG